jgi:hypothetical protein
MTRYSNRNVYVDGTDIVRRIYIDYDFLTGENLLAWTYVPSSMELFLENFKNDI